MTDTKLNTHPIAACWPPLGEVELQELIDSIKAHGLLHPIVLYEDQVLDGRNRLEACSAAGVEPRFTQYEGEDPIGFCEAANNARRHLTPAQRAMIAGELAKLPRGRPQPSIRELVGQAPGQDTGQQNRKAAVLADADGPEDGPVTGRISRRAADLAAQFRVSKRAVEQAKEIHSKGIPEVVEAVKANKLTLNRATQIVKLPPEKQATAIIEEPAFPVENTLEPAIPATSAPQEPDPCPRCADLTDEQLAGLRASEEPSQEEEAAPDQTFDDLVKSLMQ